MDEEPLAPQVYYQYTAATCEKYRACVYLCTCYNTRTATDILVQHKCRLFSAGKIRALVDEFMKDRKDIEEKESVAAKDLTTEDSTTADPTAGNSVVAKDPSSQVKRTYLPATNYTRTTLLLQIIKQLPSYARVGGGMMICALAKYLTAEQLEEELDDIENSQDTRVLWAEQFIRANKVLKEANTSDSTDSQINTFIETEAEKMPLRLACMRDDEYVELTFID
jgi:hypothetical protein